MTGIAARPIRAGEEVSDNYYPSAPCVARPERRRWLAEHFLFHCECGACSEDLPLLADMPDTPSRWRRYADHFTFHTAATQQSKLKPKVSRIIAQGHPHQLGSILLNQHFPMVLKAKAKTILS